MKKILITFAGIIVLFSSCQKGITNPDSTTGGTTGGGTTGGPVNTSGILLTKVVAKSGSDSSTTIYQYNSAKQVIRQSTTGISQGADATNDILIVRNSAGIITQTIQKNPTSQAAGIDSVVRNVHYDAASKRYTSATQPITYSSFTVMDSTVFIYNAAGKIVEEDIYVSAFGLNFLASKWLITYDATGANLASISVSATSSPASPAIPAATISASYDNKINPMMLGNEAFAIGQEQLFNANNATLFQENDLANPTNSYSFTGSYTYNSSNLPITATTTQTPGNITTNATYYYQ